MLHRARAALNLAASTGRQAQLRLSHTSSLEVGLNRNLRAYNRFGETHQQTLSKRIFSHDFTTSCSSRLKKNLLACKVSDKPGHSKSQKLRRNDRKCLSGDGSQQRTLKKNQHRNENFIVPKLKPSSKRSHKSCLNDPAKNVSSKSRSSMTLEATPDQTQKLNRERPRTTVKESDAKIQATLEDSSSSPSKTANHGFRSGSKQHSPEALSHNEASTSFSREPVIYHPKLSTVRATGVSESNKRPVRRQELQTPSFMITHLAGSTLESMPVAPAAIEYRASHASAKTPPTSKPRLMRRSDLENGESSEQRKSQTGNKDHNEVEYVARHSAATVVTAESLLEPAVKEYIDIVQTQTQLASIAHRRISEDAHAKEVLSSFLKTRGLTMETANAYFLGVVTSPSGNDRVVLPRLSHVGDFEPQDLADKIKISFPRESELLDGDLVVQKVKYRGTKEKVITQEASSRTLSGLFGWHLVKDTDKQIIITEGEFDAMAVYQSTKLPAVSVPSGATSGLPEEVLSELRRFERVYLWFDTDEVGIRGREKLAQALGTDNIYIVETDPVDGKDANDMLIAGKDIKALFEDTDDSPATDLSPSSSSMDPFDSVADMREALRHYILNPPPVGTPFDGFPSLTKVVGGFREGELTIITGPTGSGKTTFLSQLSLNLARRGVRTIWGSFEIRRERLLSNQLFQFAGCHESLGGSPLRPVDNFDIGQAVLLDKLDEYAQLPIYTFKYFGATELMDVLDGITYSVQTAGMKHIIIDNLQFMVSGGGGLASAQTGWERFEIMDQAIGNFRQIASQFNCHVTVVIHPRKEKEGDMLSLQSFSGTGKASQEADNVWILQKDKEGAKYLDVRKNRFNGSLGSFPLEFARSSKCFMDVSEIGNEERTLDHDDALDRARSDSETNEGSTSRLHNL